MARRRARSKWVRLTFALGEDLVRDSLPEKGWWWDDAAPNYALQRER